MIAASVLIFIAYIEGYKALRRWFIRRSSKKEDLESSNDREIRLAPTMEPNTL